MEMLMALLTLSCTWVPGNCSEKPSLSQEGFSFPISIPRSIIQKEGLKFDPILNGRKTHGEVGHATNCVRETPT